MMTHVTVEVKKWGNSLGIIIPRRSAVELGITEHDKLDVDIRKKENIRGFGIFKGKPSFVREDDEHEDLW